MIVKEVTVTTPEGDMPTWIYHPANDGPSPVVLYLMDAPSIRPALHEMASRLASAGYYVMLPYLFYRGGPFQDFTETDTEMHQRRDLMGQLNPTNILGDCQALLDIADGDPAAGDGKVGAVGFCMSGGFVISAARAWPDRIAAVASIHGAWLVREGDDSPHLGLENRRGRGLPRMGRQRRHGAAGRGADHGGCADRSRSDYPLDFLTDAVHGYAPPGGERYNREASELHWERVHTLFRRHLLNA